MIVLRFILATLMLLSFLAGFYLTMLVWLGKGDANDTRHKTVLSSNFYLLAIFLLLLSCSI